jgi:PKD repeat protein
MKIKYLIKRLPTVSFFVLVLIITMLLQSISWFKSETKAAKPIHPIGSIVMDQDNQQYYMIYKDGKKSISSLKKRESFIGLRSFMMTEAEKELPVLSETSWPVGTKILELQTRRIWYVGLENGKPRRMAFRSLSDYLKQGFKIEELVQVDPKEINLDLSSTIITEDKVLFGGRLISNQGKFYLYLDDGFHPFINEMAMQSWGFRAEDAKVLSAIDKAKIKNQINYRIGSYLKGSGDQFYTLTGDSPDNIFANVKKSAFASVGVWKSMGINESDFLQVADNLLPSENDQVIEFDFLNKKPQAPTAVIDINRSKGSNILSVDFDASGSIDPDGEIAHYSWRFDDGEVVSNQKRVNRIYTDKGKHQVVLEVWDNDGLHAKSEVSIDLVDTQLSTQSTVMLASDIKNIDQYLSIGPKAINIIFDINSEYIASNWSEALNKIKSKGSSVVLTPVLNTNLPFSLSKCSNCSRLNTKALIRLMKNITDDMDQKQIPYLVEFINRADANWSLASNGLGESYNPLGYKLTTDGGDIIQKIVIDRDDISQYQDAFKGHFSSGGVFLGGADSKNRTVWGKAMLSADVVHLHYSYDPSKDTTQALEAINKQKDLWTKAGFKGQFILTIYPSVMGSSDYANAVGVTSLSKEISTNYSSIFKYTFGLTVYP